MSDPWAGPPEARTCYGVPTCLHPTDPAQWYFRRMFTEFFFGPFADLEAVGRALDTLDRADETWDSDPWAIHRGADPLPKDYVFGFPFATADERQFAESFRAIRPAKAPPLGSTSAVAKDDGVTAVHLAIDAPKDDVGAAIVLTDADPLTDEGDVPRGTPPCTVTDCKSGKDAHWVPVLHFHAWKGSVSAPATYDLPMCDDCRDKADVSWFLTDDGFAQISLGFTRAGKVSPVRGLTRLEWKLIDQGEHAFVDTPFDPGKKED